MYPDRSQHYHSGAIVVIVLTALVLVFFVGALMELGE